MFSFRYSAILDKWSALSYLGLLLSLSRRKKEKKNPHVTMTADGLIGPPLTMIHSHIHVFIFAVYNIYLVGYTLHIFCYALNI